jgi:nicotinamidase-related amidase
MVEKSPLILSSEESVLVVIDIQDKLYAAIEGKKDIEKQAVKVIKLARVFDIPIIATEQYPKGLGRTIPKVREALGEIRFHEKLHFSAFDMDTFCCALEETGKKDIILIGIEAHICILQTALDALENGFRLHVIADAVGSRDNWSRDLGLKKIEKAGGLISSAEIAAYELMRQAKTGEFNEVIGFLFE